MWATVVNVFAIIGGSVLGALVLKRGISQRFHNIVMQGIGLSIVLIGILSAIKAQNIMVITVSMVIGGVIGEAINIERALERLGKWTEKKLIKDDNESTFAKGFVTASLLYCVGAMAIVGSLKSGLENDYSVIYAKSVLDGIASVILSSAMGIGVILSAVTVFVYQGTITLLASWVQPILTDVIVTEMSAVGGLLIVAIGLNMMELSKFKVGNLLPAVFIPIVYYFLSGIIS